MRLADLLRGGAAGEIGRVEIARVSGFGDAGEDSLVFATDKQTLAAALGSKAGAILVSEGLDGEVTNGEVTDGRVVWVKDARLAFALAAKTIGEYGGGTQIHPTAVIGERAEIGWGCRVGAGAVIGDCVTLGMGCDVGARVTVYAGTRLGDRVVVQTGAVLGSAGFGYARDAETGRYVLFPQQGRLEIEDDVEIGANTTIDRGALGETRIGAGTKIDNLVHIGHNCVIGRNVIIAAQTGISGSSVIEDGAILGGQVGIGEHATVGAGVILGGGAGVLTGKKMRGAGQVFWGRPARPLKEYLRDLARLRRR